MQHFSWWTWSAVTSLLISTALRMPPSVLLGCSRCVQRLLLMLRYEIVTGSTLANGGLAVKSVVGKESLASRDLDRGLVSPEYPWAAKMNPSVRNLHQVTNPSFMEDGTPKVSFFHANKISPPPSISHLDATTESLVMGSTPTLPVIDTPIAQAPPIVQRGGNGIAESVLGSNRFASLIYLEGEEVDLMSSDIETNSNDLMTPFGKRILRERPVKSTAKVRKMHFQFTGSGRGNRGRGSGSG
ncbi:hypothetical protein HID58_046512 [Brassica napus]|uniref:Uncharacterized protein n=1 Tax=Brassica napus TaxID=3708 RepID=A0ABQ8AWR4_BRANA|nr:hypothetical protein HID58_046512 [Brassica napus]